MKTTYLYFAVFVLLTASAVCLLRLDRSIVGSAKAFLNRQAKAKSFKKQSKVNQRLNALLTKCCDLIANSNMPLLFYFILSLGCGIGGYVSGKMIFSSFPIALAVATFGLIAPLLFFGFRQTKSHNAWLSRLASSMLILSNSYVTTEDFIVSVRDNLDTLDYPAPFKEFLTYVTYMDSDVKAGLRRLDEQIRNPYCSQWIDALILAQDDRALKYTCISVVDSMHDVLQVQAESDAAMYAVWRDYLLTLILIFSVPLVFKFTLADAYVTLTTSVVGQGLFVLLLLTVFYSVLRALKINRPLMM